VSRCGVDPSLQCMHRFCRACIERAVRASHCCPFCRESIPSRRSTRADSAFDGLIRMLYPDLEDYEAEEQRKVDTFSRAFSTGSMPERSELAQRTPKAGDPPAVAGEPDEPAASRKRGRAEQATDAKADAERPRAAAGGPEEQLPGGQGHAVAVPRMNRLGGDGAPAAKSARVAPAASPPGWAASQAAASTAPPPGAGSAGRE